jgi:hypothetical protein
MEIARGLAPHIAPVEAATFASLRRVKEISVIRSQQCSASESITFNIDLILKRFGSNL